MRLDDFDPNIDVEDQRGRGGGLGFGGGGGGGMLFGLLPLVFSRFGCGGVVVLLIVFALATAVTRIASRVWIFNAARAAETRSNGALTGEALALVDDERVPTTPQSSLARFEAFAPFVTPAAALQALRGEAVTLSDPLIRLQGRTPPDGGASAIRKTWDKAYKRKSVRLADGAGNGWGSARVLIVFGLVFAVIVRGERQAEAAGEVDRERRHHQADDVVDQERRQQPAAEDNGRQQVMRVQPDDNPLGDPVEEADDPQVPGHQHHREQQDDGGEVDRAERVAGVDDTKGHHQHGTDDRRARPIDAQSGELADRKNQIAGEEDDVGREHAGFREQSRIDRRHQSASCSVRLSALRVKLRRTHRSLGGGGQADLAKSGGSRTLRPTPTAVKAVRHPARL